MEFVRTLADVGRNDIAMAGGKGANLGELMRAKLPVPPGFVLLTSAYKAFVEANELTEEIERLASKASLQPSMELEEDIPCLAQKSATGHSYPR